MGPRLRSRPHGRRLPGRANHLMNCRYDARHGARTGQGGDFVRTPTVWHDVESTLGEGPVWDAQRARLVWVDILAGVVRVARPRGTASGSSGSTGSPCTWAPPCRSPTTTAGCSPPASASRTWTPAARYG